MKTILCLIILLMFSCSSYFSEVSRVPAQEDKVYSNFAKAKDLFM